MSLLSLCQQIENSAVGTAIRESIWLFPIIETTHVLALALSVGTLMIFDLRLMGVAMPDIGVRRLHLQLRPWFLAGFALMFATGALLFWSEATRCYQSTAFWIKMGLIVLAGANAVLFERFTAPTAYREAGDPLPRLAVIAGWASLVLWAAVIGTGRWMAYNLT